MALLPRTKAQWSRLTHTQKEEAWYTLNPPDDDPRFPVPITTANDALVAFAGHLNDKPPSTRSIPRRGYLAALKGGQCEMNRLKRLKPTLSSLDDCYNTIQDYRRLRLWEFNHIVSRAISPDQFVISGSDCTRRRFMDVREHCLRDTVLLCRECHWSVTELEKTAQIIAGQALYGAFGSDR